MSAWRVEADRLRADEGLSIRQIAERVGMSSSAVGEHLTPHRCECGNRRNRQHARCNDCRRASEAAARDERESVLIRMWREGARRTAIAEATGFTPGSVSARVAILRAAGVDLPYRRPSHVVEHGRRIGARPRVTT